MASKKKEAVTRAETMSLFAPAAVAPVARPEPDPVSAPEPEPTSLAEDPPAVEDATHAPKLRIVPSLATIAESEVIVEKVRDVYEVSLLRRGNTTAAVFYTREQLEQLIERAKGALEVG